MKISYDKDVDALYFTFNDATTVEDSEEVRPDLVLDFDSNHHIVGFELLNASKQVSAQDLQKISQTPTDS